MSRANSGNSRLRGDRRRGDVMAAYDRLPRDLRCWLANAALPWSLRSARRVWRRALARSGGDPVRARGLLSGLEARLLQKDARAVWGGHHPQGSGALQRPE